MRISESISPVPAVAAKRSVSTLRSAPARRRVAGGSGGEIAVKRAREPAREDDGLRVLVDRLWPRGLTREEVTVDLWLKDAAPSAALRRWYSHDPSRWESFARKYRAELAGRVDLLRLLEGLCPHCARARDLMSRRVISVAEDTPLARIAGLLEWHHIGRVPVLRANRLVGIVSRADVVRAIAAQSRSFESLDAQTDDSIRERLVAELERQPWWHSQWSNVFVSGGVVSYRGLVDSDEERQAARVAAENVSGVRGVEDGRIDVAEWQTMV